MTLKQFHSLCIKHVLGYFDENQDLPTTIFSLKPDGDVIALFRDYEDNDEKNYTYNLYATILAAEKTTMYCLASEAWWYQETAPNIDMKNAVAPSKHPDKQSAIITIASDRNNNTVSEMFAIKETETRRVLSNEALGNETNDNVKLFDRIPKNHGVNLDMLLQIPKPDWYKTIPKAAFANVKVDA